MPPRAKPPETDPILARLDDIAALLAVVVKRDRTAADVIGDLSATGLGPTRIAGLLGTSSGYVDNVIARKKAAAAKASKASPKLKGRT